MVSDDFIEGKHIETEDVIDVVEMVKVLRYQFLQTTAIEMARVKMEASLDKGMQRHSHNVTYIDITHDFVHVTQYGTCVHACIGMDMKIKDGAYINQRWCEHCLPFHQLSQTMVPIMGYVRGSFTPTCTCCLCIRHSCYTHLVLPKIGSQQGTTQEDPLAMVMYALGTLPLIHAVSTKGAATQTWYADNATAGGRLVQLHMWWDQLQWKGPAFGYFINSSLMQTSSATMFN